MKTAESANSYRNTIRKEKHSKNNHHEILRNTTIFKYERMTKQEKPQKSHVTVNGVNLPLMDSLKSTKILDNVKLKNIVKCHQPKIKSTVT